MTTISTTDSLEEVNKKISEASGDYILYLVVYSVGAEDLEMLEGILDTVSQYLTDKYKQDYFEYSILSIFPFLFSF